MLDDGLGWSDRNEMRRRGKNADQAEMQAIFNGTAPAASGVEDDQLAGTVDDDASSDADASWNEREEAIEVAAGEVYSELERRAYLLGSAYPFQVKDGGITYAKSNNGVYEFCLATSLVPSINVNPFVEVGVGFERLATEVARTYLGDAALAVRTGWPSHDHAQRPVKFKDLSKIVFELCGEWIWQPSPGNSDDPPHTDVKDEGVDYVIWLPMLDKRAGKLFMLGQCACGDNWDTKLNDINDGKLKRWLNPVTFAKYTTAFSVPIHIGGQHIFPYCNQQAGITFDRTRIVLIAAAREQHFTDVSTSLGLSNLTKIVWENLPAQKIAGKAAATA